MVNTNVEEAATLPAPSPTTRPREHTPEAFRHYLVERRDDGTLWELGRGGMGVTYKAVDVNLHCPVALKIIGPQSFDSESSRRRFIREARLAAQIRHPNVAAIYHLDTQDDDVFYAMEFVDGVTADAWVKGRGPMSVEMALDVAMQVARALTAADRMRLVHRDIKPANIMLHADPADHHRVIVKVIDFGLARSLSAESMSTATTCAFVGTPQFSSPEQVENLELDTRSDIYSLGCTLWFLLAGRAPFTGPMARVMAEQLTARPPLQDLGNVPTPVKELLQRMLEKDRNARPQTPFVLHSEICRCREILSRHAARAKHAFVPLKVACRILRQPARQLACYALILCGTLASLAWVTTNGQRSDPAAIAGRMMATAVSPSETVARSPDETAIVNPVSPADEELGTDLADHAPTAISPNAFSLSMPVSDLDSGSPPFWSLDGSTEASNALDLSKNVPVSLSLTGAISGDQAAKLEVKAPARPDKRRSQTSDRRLTPLDRVQRAGRSITGFVHRLF